MVHSFGTSNAGCMYWQGVLRCAGCYIDAGGVVLLEGPIIAGGCNVARGAYFCWGCNVVGRSYCCCGGLNCFDSITSPLWN